MIEKLKENMDKINALLAALRSLEEDSEEKKQDTENTDEQEKTHYLEDLRTLVRSMQQSELIRIIEELERRDRFVVWNELPRERANTLLEVLSDEAREDLIGDSHYRDENTAIAAFELKNGRLSQIAVGSLEDLKNIKPIWVDLVAPTIEIRNWVGRHFDVDLPNPVKLTDLESSARLYIEDNGEVHLHSDFLLDTKDGSRNVAVALILHRDILFTVRTEELPVFRLQRLRARTQPGYVTEGKDVLLDLYAADAEYSADALEDVYAALEEVGKQVLGTEVTDTEAAKILADIASEEDLNGRIRRNVHDTRRAVSFLIRSKLLNSEQMEDARQILRDIESLDGHTSFLFGKINFLMDATVGFININQNKIIKIFSVASVAMLPPTLIASVYGMNFRMMPEVDWEYGYPFSLLLMFISVAAPFWFFHKKGWLRR